MLTGRDVEMEETLDVSEHRLVELKAKVEDHNRLRQELQHLQAHLSGIHHQVDTYYKVPEGRLKLRETEGKEKAELIYYERDDAKGPKESTVFILRIRKPENFKTLFDIILKKKIVVDKRREIYDYRGTQIHLDVVEGLGQFVELERKTPASIEDIRKSKKDLEELIRRLGIEKRNLVSESYSDLISST